MNFLRGNTRLTRLTITDNVLRKCSFEDCQVFPKNLRELTLTGNGARNWSIGLAIEHLIDVEGLLSLTIELCPMSERMLWALSNMKQLEVLRLISNNENSIDESWLFAVGRKLTNLREFELVEIGCLAKICESGWCRFVAMANQLNCLSCRYNTFGDFEYLRLLETCQNRARPLALTVSTVGGIAPTVHQLMDNFEHILHVQPSQSFNM